MKPPDAASIWIGILYPVLPLYSSRAVFNASTSSFIPVHVTPIIGTMQIVFSSHMSNAASMSSVGCSCVIGTVRISICQSWQNFSHTTWYAVLMTRFGLSYGFPSALRRSRHRSHAATPPSIHASDEPMPTAPVFQSPFSGVFHMFATILMQRPHITATRGYSVSSM